MEFEPIGVVRSPAREAIDEGWGKVASEIHLREELAPGLRGLQEYSHLLVLFYMHQAEYSPEKHLVRHLRDDLELPLTGIFAQRARHRPNPIGVTAVKLEGVEGNVVRVRGLDAIDGTPVLDIKPYYPVFDRVDDATVPAWVARLMEGYF